MNFIIKKRLIYLFCSILLIVLFVPQGVIALTSNKPNTITTTVFTIRGGNGNDVYDANGNPILRAHKIPRGTSVIKLDASLNGRTAELPVNTSIFLYFPNGEYKVTISPNHGVVERPEKYGLPPSVPFGDTALLTVVGQGTATITVTKTYDFHANLPVGAASTSANWSGYYHTTGGPYTDITSQWTVPTASVTSNKTFSYHWIGVDNGHDTNGDLLQIGTYSEYDPSGTGQAYYGAWKDNLPADINNGAVPISGTVNPGDSMSAEVKQNSGTNWTITIRDLTQNWSSSSAQTYNGSGNTAEWIVEAPPPYPLNNYGLETFTNDTQNGANPNHTYSTDSLDMVQNGTTVSSTSNPNNRADAFAVAYGLTQPAAPSGWYNSVVPGTTQDQINGMAAINATSAWTAGWEQPSGADKKPVSYLNTGSGFTKYYPSDFNSNDNILLHSIAGSSSDAWAVGEDQAGPTQTVAYHWSCSSNCSNSSWSHVTSDNVGTSHNILNAVAYAGSDIFAVGKYYASGYQPLLEKWNGTKFANQTLTLPGGETTGVLYGVSFSSSTNGWAVGNAGGTTNSYIIYQYNGSNWSSTLGSTSSAVLNSVIAVSNSEAWAVGSQGTSHTPLILHYLNGSWTEDTSFNGSYPSGVSLISVSADSSSNVWIVGYVNSNTPYTMHYNGSSWTQVPTRYATRLYNQDG